MRRLIRFIQKFFPGNGDGTDGSGRRLSDSPYLGSSHPEQGQEIVKRGGVMLAVKQAMTQSGSSRRLEESCEEVEPLLSFAVNDFLSINFDFGEFC